jgi:hypothetical protein
MNTPTIVASSTTLVLACFTAFAADVAPSKDEVQLEVIRQQDIYRSRGPATPSGYTIDRALVTYARGLNQGFLRELAALRSNDRWLDIGAGEGRAVMEYCTSPSHALPNGFEPRSGGRAKALAMSIEDRRTKDWFDAAADLPEGQMRYIFGKPMGEYAAGELGQFQLITDVMGGFSYTPRLSTFMEKTLGALSVDGTFFTVLADVRSESQANPPHYAGAPHLTRILAAGDSELKICNWLKRIGCVEVSCEFKSDWTPPIEAYRIRKVCEDVKVPALELDHYQAGTPPERRFRLVDGAQRSDTVK